jgi:hypothetical protein
MTPSRRTLRALLPGLVAVTLLAVSCSLVDSSEDTTPDAQPPTGPGTIVITSETEPPGQAGAFQVTGVPSGTVSTGGTLVVADLPAGTYTTTQVDPAPEFDLTSVACDDQDSGTPSSGDPGTRSAVINLDAGETVTCRFTNTQRGTVVIATETLPADVTGSFRFTGVPSGTVPTNGTLVVANLAPGTYTTTEASPAPEFDLTAVECDDGASSTPSGGDPGTRSAVFNIDPGEMITCVFTNARRGAAVVAMDSDDPAGLFQFTGVPSGTIPADGTLVVADLTPGTYTSTLADQDGLVLTDVVCDDGTGGTPSSGDASTRSAVFNLDPGETVTCVFTDDDGFDLDEWFAAGGATGGSGGGGPGLGDGVNPFVEPDDDFDQFPLPDDPSEIPSDAGTYAAPRPGPWSVTNFAGQIACGAFSLPVPASPPESGTIEVLDDGMTVVGTSLSDAPGEAIALTADPTINGRYTGSFDGIEEGVPVVIDYYWQVVTDEYIVGFLTSDFTQEGVTCSVYRPFELFYTG